MDRSIRRLPTTTVRVSITLRWPSITVTRRPSVPAVDRPGIPATRPLAIPARPRSATIPRRPAVPGARRLALAAVLAAAIVLFATLPVLVVRLVMDSGLWDLAGHLAGRATRPGLPAPVLPLLLGSIVVLAVVSSSSGHHHRCDCC
jgi:hypothetical protein